MSGPRLVHAAVVAERRSAVDSLGDTASVPVPSSPPDTAAPRVILPIGSSDGPATASWRKPAWVIAGAGLVAFWGWVLLATFDFPASALDEGTLVAYPSRLLLGDVPHRDFVTLYGPGNIWIIGMAFKLFGAALDVERAVGLGFRLLALGSVLVIGARFGRAAAVAGAALAAVVWVPWYAQANAALGAISLTLFALALLSLASRRDGRAASGLPALGGAAAGLAVLLRFDFAPAVVLATAPLLVATRGVGRRAFLLGALPMLLLGAGHLAIVGPDGIERVLRDIVASAPARDLPVPGLDTEGGRLFALSVFAAIAATATGIWAMRRDRMRSGDGALLAGLGLFVAGLVPYMFGRADVFHITTAGAVGCVAIACLLGYAAQRAVPSGVLGAAAVALVAAGLAGQVTDLHGPRFLVEHRLGRNPGIGSVEVHAGGRSYRLFPDSANQLQSLLDTLQATARRGERLYVGPRDLRFAEYDDAFLYYLLPQLTPASIYLEDNPGTVNGPRHDLSADLRRADFLVLNSAHDLPNPDPADAGSAQPNRVVERDFRPLLRAGTFELFARKGLHRG
jgi:hypothetical protein